MPQLTIVDGASLIYTSTSVPNSLPTLIRSTLGIHSQLKKQTLKHNVIDRDKVLVPPNWDSWGKIRVIREGFDVEGTSSGWNIDIQSLASTAIDGNTETTDAETSQEGAVLPTYESTIPDPHTFSSSQSKTPAIESSIPTTQAFLTAQLQVLEKLKADDEAAAATAASSRHRELNNTGTFTNMADKALNHHDERLNEHIGPVQVNMGGIQVDADDMLKRLRSRKEGAEALSSGGGGSRAPKSSTENAAPASSTSLDDMKAENEKLTVFFEELKKKAAGESPKGSTSGKRDVSRDGGGDTPSKKAAAVAAARD